MEKISDPELQKINPPNHRSPATPPEAGFYWLKNTEPSELVKNRNGGTFGRGWPIEEGTWLVQSGINSYSWQEHEP